MIYVNTGSQDPAFNFAVEAYFMTEKPQVDTVFLFWHTQPTVMLGKFQNSYKELNLAAIQEDGVQVVRRQTGGGTIYTDLGGWQFSFITPGKRTGIDFRPFMEPIVAALETLGIQAEFNSRNDLTVAGQKFSGNAQASQGDFTLHHGSLLYDTDLARMVRYCRPPVYKLKAKGIDSIQSRTTNLIDYLPERWSSQTFADKMLSLLLKSETETYSLTAEDKARVNQIADQKFRSWDWTYGKNPAFSLQREAHTPGGQIEIALEIKNGLIEGCQIQGDFFSAVDLGQFVQALKGLPYQREALADFIFEQFPNLIHNVSSEKILDIFI